MPFPETTCSPEHEGPTVAEPDSLHLKNELGETLLESLSDMVCELDGEGRCISLRASYTGLLNTQPEDLIGCPISEVLCGAIADQAKSALNEAALKGCSKGREFSLDTHEGQRWFELFIHRHPRSWENKPHYICFIRDITHRKSALSGLVAAREQANRDREAIENANALKARLLAFTSHDLKSPLIALGTTCKLLDDAADDPAEVRDLARLMAGEARRMSRLISDFIDRSAIEEGSLRFEKQAFDLPFLAAGVLGEHRSAAEVKRHTLSLLPPSAHPAPAFADPTRVERILANLIENAVKYTPCGGRITLAFGETPDAIWCSVEDNGPGLTKADLARIFLPNPKFSTRPTSVESSHGFSLALALELARLQGGDIAAGNLPGAGARFRLTLPRA